MLLLQQAEVDEAVALFAQVAAANNNAQRVHLRAAVTLADHGFREHAEHFLNQAEAAGPLDASGLHTVTAIRGTGIPDRASPDHVAAQSDDHAESFDTNLLSLGYRGPELIGRAIDQIGLPAGEPLEIIDAGCGTGLCGPILRPYAGRLIGMDLSEKMLALARDRECYDEMYKMDLVNVGTRFPGKFDLVVSSDVLVYFGKLEAVLAAFRAALRSGGYLILTVETSPETGATPDYFLQPNGRYRHDVCYLREATQTAGFNRASVEIRDTLRAEYQKPVEGTVICAQAL